VREYRLEPLRLRLFYVMAAVAGVIGIVLGLFFLLVVGSLGLDLVGLVIVALPLMFLGGIALAIVLAARAVRLELTASGIRLHLPGTEMTADWEDVESIAPMPWGPLSGEALKLRRPARVRRAWWFMLLADPDYESSIPLSPFATPFAGSPLEADLRTRLPPLFSSQAPGA
jgi:hypothetical protein